MNAAVSDNVMKEEDVFMPARELKIRRGLKEDEGGAGSQ